MQVTVEESAKPVPLVGMKETIVFRIFNCWNALGVLTLTSKS